VGVPELEAWIPERLFLRLLAYGQAYSLHNLLLLHSQEDSLLNSLQCEGLLRELDFVSEVSNDPALQMAVSLLRDVTERVASERGLQLEFSPN
jgi:hypothetical protein